MGYTERKKESHGHNLIFDVMQGRRPPRIELVGDKDSRLSLQKRREQALSLLRGEPFIRERSQDKTLDHEFRPHAATHPFPEAL